MKKYFKFALFLAFLLCVVFMLFALNETRKKQKNLKEEALTYKNELNKQLDKTKILQAKFVKKSEKNSNKLDIRSYEFSVNELKKTFYSKPSYDLALRLARLYYEDKDYKKSIFWALKANELDKSIFSSWLIFAKAQKALGNNNKARKALESYTRYYGFIELDEEL